jgi:GGDEF domain-containing protein
MNVLVNTSAAQHDPLTGFGDYQKLIGDLTRALEPGSATAVLAVFELGGSSDYRRDFGERASAELILRCAERFGRVISPVGVCYRPRQDEFCALVVGLIDEVDVTLLAAKHAIRDGEEPVGIEPFVGSALLPVEATDPVDLLILADERLGVSRAGRPPRERRQVVRRPE